MIHGQASDERVDRKTILVVDDEETFRKRLMRALADRGFEPWGAGSAEEALERVAAGSSEYALVDLRMPGTTGLQLVRQLHALDPTTLIVVLTGYGSIATALDAVRSGAVHYLTKPADIDEITAAFEPRAERPALPVTEVPSLARVEWEHLERVLTQAGGNITQAARLLGIHRRSLQRKLGKSPQSR